MERDDSVNIIEGGNEHDLNAEAFADMAMSNMDVSLELHTQDPKATAAHDESQRSTPSVAQQIRAFLTRNETQSDRSDRNRQQSEPPSQENGPSAYEVLRNGAVHYSRREDKVKALQEHPVVRSVSSDGRTVGCKCGRNVKLNPPCVLSRSKAPKKLENIKYMPSVYTESDPFLRKLSKNSAFRGLYQTVKRMVSAGNNSDSTAERVKQVYFWLRFSRMGVFGHFKTHPVFEGLMKSMVEMKDKERRGVGKQNMQYSRALDEFMQSMTQLSTEAFELFATQFCGRTLRSQKVKRRSTSATAVFNTPSQPAIGAGSASVDDVNSAVAPTTHQSLPSPNVLQPHQHQHYLMPPDDLLTGRSLSTEESQRFMDRMLDEVRLSVSREMQLAEEECRRSVVVAHDQQSNEEDDSSRLGPETYLNDEGVLTTEI
ncbi:hypothetical protein PHMEG_0001690 [Phytophthora megakarya]|uniref:Uncharacterized protein n=1 Tax=Phytophthora megakarya TaxID=4795 RepID=A0A225X2G2_9STRA|nr:hypothetical protein PHMEG_0001690 [Phytophthora megakarya]